MDLSLFNNAFFITCLIIAAEMGDKSQVVCMVLASKYRSRLVFSAAVAAFFLLNVIAVTFGALIANFIPAYIVSSIAIILFLWFAYVAFTDDEEAEQSFKSTFSKSIFISVFALIISAEMGDKTQIAIATIAASEPPWLVWISASLALVITTGFGVYAGKKWLSKLSRSTVNRVSAALFVCFALFIAFNSIIV